MRRGRQPAGTPQFNKVANQNYRRLEPQAGYQGFKPIGPKQQNQADLIEANDITFSIGPAGTGKTHVAIAKAVEAFANGECATILLCRPAVEAGETIGFLPGGQNEKMAPYMRPLYDELDNVYGKGKYAELIVDERNPNRPIEVAPVGTMRGRTFKNAFVIIDEAQNLKPEELKMILTRLGEGSKIVITGDPQQIDLAPIKNKNGEEVTASGLMEYVEKLKGVEGVAVHTYGAEDVMRHPTVKRIVDRLDALEGKDQVNQPVAKRHAL
jgi:phosphate starvation-inducible PhoH-like protein